MIRKARDVESYMKEVPAERRAALEKLRALCRRIFKDCEETIDYGMPVYKRNDAMQVAFASQKQYIAVYAGSVALNEFRDSLGAASMGKGCVRFTKPEQMDFALIEKLLRRTAQARGKAC